mmetsp:Transcript_4/g.9  ORF Transcript_4/g.9 Transcript_4/m.9 type:complete len:1613 (+) Transcript_4:295-5133(+)
MLRSLEMDHKAEADLKALEECFNHCPGCGRAVRALREGCRSGLVGSEILRVELEQERGALRHRIRQFESERGDFRRREEQLRARVKALELQRDDLYAKLQKELSVGRSKSSGVASKVVAKQAVIQGGANVLICFSAWRGLREDRKKDLQEAQKLKQQKRYQNALNAWGQSSARALRRSCFTGWLGVALGSNTQREAELRERRRWSAVARRELNGRLAAEDLCRMQACVGAWQLEVELHRLASSDLARQRASSRHRGQFGRALGCWADSANLFYMRCCFAGWLWGLDAARDRQVEREKRKETARKALEKFVGAEFMGLTKLCLDSWRAALGHDRFEAEKASSERAAQLQYQKAMDSWTRSTHRSVKESCFHGWLAVIEEEARKKRMDGDERARREAIAMKAFAQMCSEQAASAVQVCLLAWGSLLEEKRKAAILSECRRLEAQQAQQYDRALGVWANSSEKALRQTTFQAWSTMVSDERIRKEAEAQERQRRSQSSMKAIEKFVQSEADKLIRAMFGFWQALLQQKKDEEIKEERDKMKALARDQFERSLGCISQGSTRVLRRSCFVAWSEITRESKKAAEDRDKHYHSVVRSTAKFMQASAENMARICLGAMKALLDEKRKEEIDAAQHRLQMMSQQQFQKSLGALANNHDKVLRNSLFVAWSGILAEKRRVMEEKAQKSVAASKTVSRLIAAEGDQLLHFVFKKWWGIIEQKRQDDIEAQAAKFRLMQQKQFENALGALSQSSERSMRRGCFHAWSEIIRESRKEAEDRARRSQAATKALSRMCLAEQSALLCFCISNWKAVYDASLRLAIDADRHRLHLMQQKQFESALRCLATSSDRSIKQSSFLAWMERLHEVRDEAVQQLNERARLSAVAMQALTKMCCADDHSLVQLYYNNWAAELDRARRERIDAERARMDERERHNFENTLSVLAKSSERALKASLWAAWASTIAGEKKMRETRMQEQLKRATVATQFLQKMTAAHDGSSVRACLNAWREVFQIIVVERIMDEKQRLVDVQNKQLDSALRCMAQSSDRSLRSSAFVVWHDFLLEAQAARQLAIEEKSKRTTAAIQAVAQVCAADGDALCRFCMHIWVELYRERVKEALHAERQRIKSMQLRSYERAMGGLATSNDEIVLKAAWTAWRLLAHEGKERRLAEMKEKASRSEGAVKALARLCKNDAQSLLRVVIGAWVFLVEERRREQIEDEKRRLKSIQLKQAEKALGNLAHSSETTQMKSVLVAWHMDMKETKNRRQLELEEKAKRSQVAMKSLAKFCQAEESAGIRMCLSSWATILEIKRREEIQAERQRLSELQRAQFQKTAGCLANSSDRANRQSYFLAWFEALAMAKERKSIELEEKAKRSAVAMRSLSKFCESQTAGLLQIFFAAWCHDMEEMRNEALRAETARLKARQEVRYDHAMDAWALSERKNFLATAFAQWLEVLCESRFRKELLFEYKTKNSESTKKAMDKIVDAQTGGVASLYFGAWRFVLEEKAKEAMDREFNKLKSDNIAFERVLQDRVLRSLIGCRLGARFRTRRSRDMFLAWLDTMHELRGRGSRVRQRLPRQDRSQSPAFVKANKHTTVGALLASAQAQAQSRDSRAKRALAARLELE